MKLWGGRFTKGEDADMTSFDNSLPTSKLLYIEKMLLIAKKIVSTLKINRVKLQKAVKNGFLNATDLADYLVKKGRPFRDAHTVVGQAVLFAEKHQKALEDLTIEELKQFDQIIDEDVYHYLNIQESIHKGIKKEML
ncbi:hypothetical protein [Oenococcus oeni]